jgi:hypothetical protein
MGIAAGMRDIVQDIASSYDLRMAEVKGLKKEANEMLGSFKASQDKMGAQLRKDLARDKAKMGAEVKAMRSGFQSSHKEMSSALTKDLADHNRAVKDEAARLRQEIGASHQDRSDEVKAMRSGFQRSHKQMGAQLRKDLASYDHGIKSEVSGMRQETMADMKEARTAWQGLGSTMQAKRGGTKTPPKVAAPTANEENPNLETKLLAAVNEHRAGVTLAEAAESLGVAPIVLGRTSKRLLKNGKIRKKEMLYFPVSAK